MLTVSYRQCIDAVSWATGMACENWV